MTEQIVTSLAISGVNFGVSITRVSRRRHHYLLEPPVRVVQSERWHRLVSKAEVRPRNVAAFKQNFDQVALVPWAIQSIQVGLDTRPPPRGQHPAGG
jgi:hypothetical protein